MLESLIDELTPALVLPPEILALRMIGATVFCGVIGLERELHKNTAGLRTNMLIGLASAAFCMITLHMMEALAERNDAMRLDPLRLVEAVTAGIAFLATGVVIYSKGNVKGLTTGASIWLSGAIGLACGLGVWSVAVLATFAGVVILWLVRRMEIAAGIKDE